MEKQDVIEAYFTGGLDRRQFLKLMVSFGVSLVAAGAYADAIAKSAAAVEPEPRYGARPTIVPLNPQPGARIANRAPVIRARVTDDTVDLRKRDISFYFGKHLDFKGFPPKRDFDYDPEKNLLTYRPGRLSHGRYYAVVTAYDGANYTIKKWSFTVVRRRGERGGGRGGGATVKVGNVEARAGGGGATARVGNLRARAR